MQPRAQFELPVNPSEKNQSDAWIVRVQGKEYGPVDLDELRDWKREGRLIRENEIREPGSDRWIPAGELPEIFSDEVEDAPELEPPPLPGPRRKSFGEIFSDGWQIYRAGFKRFFVLALLVSIPAFFLQLAAPFLEMPKDQGSMVPVLTAAAVAFVMLVLLVIAWPFSLAATQLLAADLHAGRDPSVHDLLGRAKPLWSRMFFLGLIVYGSYILWTAIPLAARPLARGRRLGQLAIWSRSCSSFSPPTWWRGFSLTSSSGNRPARSAGGRRVEALQESKDLARSGAELPRAAKTALSRRDDRFALVARDHRPERRDRAAVRAFQNARRDQPRTGRGHDAGDGGQQFCRPASPA